MNKTELFHAVDQGIATLANPNACNPDKVEALAFLRGAFDAVDHDIKRLVLRNTGRGKHYAAVHQAIAAFQSETGNLSVAISGAERSRVESSLTEIREALFDAGED